MSVEGSAILEAPSHVPDEVARPSTPSPASPRWLALDLFRFAAAALMVQGHVFTELLSRDYAGQRWLRHHGFVHGYTAPMFLFAAGLAFGVTTFRAWDKTTRPGRPVVARLARYAMLVAIGYLLHWPVLTLNGFRYLDEGAWRTFLAVDVLQHIGVSLGLLQLVAMLVRTPGRLAALCAVLFTFSISAAPYLWTLDASAAPDFVASYLSPANGSMFPLLPWGAFTWAGVLVAYGLREEPRPSETALGTLVLTTALVLLVPIAVNRLGLRPYGPHEFWRSSPFYLFFRLGNVMAVLTGACLVERGLTRFRLEERAPVRAVVRFAGLVGQESLVVYVAHIMALHGVLGSDALATWYGHGLSVGEAIAVTVVVGALSMALAAAWGARKQRRVARA